MYFVISRDSNYVSWFLDVDQIIIRFFRSFLVQIMYTLCYINYFYYVLIIISHSISCRVNCIQIVIICFLMNHFKSITVPFVNVVASTRASKAHHHDDTAYKYSSSSARDNARVIRGRPLHRYNSERVTRGSGMKRGRAVAHVYDSSEYAERLNTRRRNGAGRHLHGAGSVRKIVSRRDPVRWTPQQNGETSGANATDERTGKKKHVHSDLEWLQNAVSLAVYRQCTTVLVGRIPKPTLVDRKRECNPDRPPGPKTARSYRPQPCVIA